MKKDQVKIGETYTAKVSGGIATVRITEEVWIGELHKGWKGVNVQTGRSVRVKSAQRLRAVAGGGKPPAPSEPAKAARLPVAGDVAPAGETAEQGTPGRKAASPRPPKPAKAATPAKPGGKGKRRQVRPTKGTRPAKARKPREGGKLSGLDA
ncbi:MAG: hypothetical protein WD749_07065, partial [Phycisphaerales bacterium]